VKEKTQGQSAKPRSSLEKWQLQWCSYVRERERQRDNTDLPALSQSRFVRGPTPKLEATADAAQSE